MSHLVRCKQQIGDIKMIKNNVISYKDFIVESKGRLYVPMTPSDQRLTGCHTYFFSNTDKGRAEAKKEAIRYARHFRRGTLKTRP